MKLKIINFLILMFILIQLVLPVALLAVEIAPRISDREIIEKLAILEVGQGALRSEMKSGQEALRSEMKLGQEALAIRLTDLRSEMKSGQEAVSQRLDSSNNTMLVLFGSLITLIVALFGYIAWDRRTMVKPVVEQLHRLEHDVLNDLDLHHAQGSLLKRQLKALREYARTNQEFAEILRGLALL